MKHRLFALLDGMEMTRSEHDWLEQRFDNMTAKEELLFRGAVGIEHPTAVQDAIQILQSLEHYRLLYGANDDVTLGRFVMEHIHSPTPAARAYVAIFEGTPLIPILPDEPEDTAPVQFNWLAIAIPFGLVALVGAGTGAALLIKRRHEVAEEDAE